jgi:hypothetical protein
MAIRLDLNGRRWTVQVRAWDAHTNAAYAPLKRLSP